MVLELGKSITTMTEISTDITIIGAGPTGLFAAYYGGFRGLRLTIVDSMPDLGGQVTALYPEKYIYDVAGFPKVLGKELILNLVEQAMQYSPTICLNEQVRGLRSVGDRQICLTTDKREFHTRVVLITAGIGMFTPRKLPNPELARFEDRGLSYFVRSVDDFRDKDLLIIGGGDSALDWALNLEGITRKTTLIHRRDKFRAHEDSIKKLYESTVEVKTFYELKDLHGDGWVNEAAIVSNKTKANERLPVNAVLACLGFHSNLGPITEWGLQFEDDSIRVTTKMETNIPGVYAAGDIVAYPGKLKLIATGFGEAATAVNNAAAYINPSLKLFPGHSSTIMDKAIEKSE
jgi:thioredoxin reductase (NADPH)